MNNFFKKFGRNIVSAGISTYVLLLLRRNILSFLPGDETFEFNFSVFLILLFFNTFSPYVKGIFGYGKINPNEDMNIEKSIYQGLCPICGNNFRNGEPYKDKHKVIPHIRELHPNEIKEEVLSKLEIELLSK